MIQRVAALARLPDTAHPTVITCALALPLSLAAAVAVSEERLQKPVLAGVLVMAAGAVLLLAPLFPLVLALIATIPFADWKPPGSPLSISVVLALVLMVRVLAERATMRPFGSSLVAIWIALPLLLVPSAFVGSAPLAERGQLMMSILSWFAIALLVAHFVDEQRWPAVRTLLLAELVLAIVVGAFEVVAQRWLVPFPDPAVTDVEYFFGFFRPRSIALSPYSLGEFLAFTAPLVWYELGLSLRPDRLRRAAFFTGLAAAQFALLVATLSRKSLWQVAAAAVVFLLVSLGDRSIRGRLVWLAAGMAAVTLVAINVNGPALAARLTSSTSAEGVSLRLSTYADAVQLGTQNPAIGAGLGNFVATSSDRYGEQLAAYNSFAEAFADSGLLGLLAVAALVTVPLIVALRAAAWVTPPRAVVVAMLGGLIALALVESSIWRKSLAFSVGLCLAVQANARGRPEGDGP